MPSVVINRFSVSDLFLYRRICATTFLLWQMTPYLDSEMVQLEISTRHVRQYNINLTVIKHKAACKIMIIKVQVHNLDAYEKDAA